MVNIIKKRKPITFNTDGLGDFFPHMAQCNKGCETGLALLDHRLVGMANTTCCLLGFDSTCFMNFAKSIKPSNNLANALAAHFEIWSTTLMLR